MSYRITQCYLPPGRGDIPAFTSDKRLATPEGCKAELCQMLTSELDECVTQALQAGYICHLPPSLQSLRGGASRHLAGAEIVDRAPVVGRATELCGPCRRQADDVWRHGRRPGSNVVATRGRVTFIASDLNRREHDPANSAAHSQSSGRRVNPPR